MWIVCCSGQSNLILLSFPTFPLPHCLLIKTIMPVIGNSLWETICGIIPLLHRPPPPLNIVWKGLEFKSNREMRIKRTWTQKTSLHKPCLSWVLRIQQTQHPNKWGSHTASKPTPNLLWFCRWLKMHENFTKLNVFVSLSVLLINSLA